MSYAFNQYGWYAGESPTNRGTSIPPSHTSTTEVVGEMRCMWTEKGWVDLPYFAPPVRADKTIDSLRSKLASRQNEERKKPYILKGVKVGADELEVISDLLEGTGTKKFSFRNGSMTLTAANRTAVKAGVSTRIQAVHDRGYDIVEAVKAMSGKEARIAKFYEEINQGWPV